MIIDNKTKIFFSASSKPGNFGASIYNKLFQLYNINAVYIPRKSSSAKPLIEALKAFHIEGCSISMPLKNQVINFLDIIDDNAKLTQSVNTIVQREGKLIGYNTDIVGAFLALKSTHSTYNNVLIYGSGSVTHSIVKALEQVGVDRISIVSRNSKKARLVSEKYNLIFYEHCTAINNHFDLLVNATPASLENNHEIDILLNKTNCLFDLVVSPDYTPLVKKAQSKKISFITGDVMSKFQLQKQFEHYTGIFPNIETIDEIIYSVFKKN